MIRRTLIKFKPGVPRQIHLLLAASLWSIIGIFLMIRGMSWLTTTERLWLTIPAVIAGSLKSLFILDNSARKGVHRILELADGTCLGAVYSIKTWLLVLVMIGSGIVLRHSSLPKELLGGVYMTIGWALFFSSRHAWQAWRSLSNQQKKQ
ncbi:MAG: hypothetical protein J0652_03130 [Desulfobulbaceae bacterium]|nr:hypothetical protein [Desulfobulbaceae bacterium]